MGEIFSAIVQYGLGPVIAGTVVYLFVFLQMKRSERKQKAQEEKDKRDMIDLEREKEIERQKLEAEKEARFMGMVKEIVMQTINPPHTTEEQKQSRENNQFVAHQLDCLIDEGADRAYVFYYHNGGKDLLGHGFLKMSMMQESIAENVIPIMNEFQGVPRMLFPKLYETLEKNNYYDIDNVEDIRKSDPHTYQFMMQHGAKVAMFRPIKDERDLVVGFVGMEYSTKVCEDKKKACKNIEKKTNRIIGALLGQSNK